MIGQGRAQWFRWVVKPAVFVTCLLPLALFVSTGMQQGLGANPVEAIRLFTGDWALRFQVITLSVTPVRRLVGWNAVLRLRRMLGLYAFFYACLHLVSYVWLDQQFLVDLIIEDILDRPYITIGVLGFLLLVPLAATSTRGMVRRLGARRWQRLHRIVYPAAIAGVVHYWWLVKSDVSEPLIYTICLAVLLGMRLFWALVRRLPSAAAVLGRAAVKQRR